MAVDATTGVTDLVQALHAQIARTPARLGGPLVGGAIAGLTDFVYDRVRDVARAVGGGLDALLAPLPALLETVGALDAEAGAAPPDRARAALLAALNGVLGDYLAATHNPLALTMALRRDGRALTLNAAALAAAIEAPSPHLVVLLHGLCMNDLQWQRSTPAGTKSQAAAGAPARPAAPHDHGAALARDLGLTPVYLHYNTGLHISTNGRAFAEQLDALVRAWPVPLESIALVGHSMGGLVARGAQHYAVEASHAWPHRLRALVCLGSPHLGAPLERAGHWIDQLLAATPYTAPFARLGRVRSAGIRDLRHGSVLDESWQRPRTAADPVLPLPARIMTAAIAASRAPARPGGPAVEPLGQVDRSLRALRGDGLVPVASALGQHADPRHALAFTHQAIAWDCSHLDLLSSPAVYAQLRTWLQALPAA